MGNKKAPTCPVCGISRWAINGHIGAMARWEAEKKRKTTPHLDWRTREEKKDKLRKLLEV